MQSQKRAINVSNVEDMKSQAMVSTPKAKLALPRSRSPRSPYNNWGSGSPRSNKHNHSPAGFSAAHANQFLAVPENAQDDPYTTPKAKDQIGNTSCSNRHRNKAILAPKKRDEMFEETSRKNRAYDPNNLSIRAFRLDSSSDGEMSTDNSSVEDSDQRQQAMNEMRADFRAYSQLIMEVEIPSDRTLGGQLRF